MMNRRFALSALGAAALLAGCAQVSHVASGEVVLRERLLVTVDRPWNQFERGMGDNTPTWTQEGISVDALRFYVGLKDGELIAPTPAEPKGTKPLMFKSNMAVNEVVALFEQLYSRGGSTFALDKIAPHPFLGAQGFRFDFSGVRKSDEVRLTGVGWGVVRNGELFVITYTAPRLAFFSRHAAAADSIARSARVKG
jgi:hypothetical protein